MNDLSKFKIEQSRKDRKLLHNRFLEKSKTYKHFLEWEGGQLGRTPASR